METPPSRRPRLLPAPMEMEELVDEILLRIPPDEPAHLVRAAAVCKSWRRIILSDGTAVAGFLRRYRAFHRVPPPLVGYFHNGSYSDQQGRRLPLPPFVSTSGSGGGGGVVVVDVVDWVRDCRHGRVLMQAGADKLIVWDPITGDQKHLWLPDHWSKCCGAAVLCAVDGCDHLDCHAGGPFLVVYCGSLAAEDQDKTWATTYSSESGEWSAAMASIDMDRRHYHVGETRPTLVIGNAVYFTPLSGSRLLKYDLRGHGRLSVIPTPSVRGIAMELEDGGLGFVAEVDNCIHRWSWQAGGAKNNGVGGTWAEQKVMELHEVLLPVPTLFGNPCYPRVVMGLVEGSTNTIFISDYAGVFAVDLKLRMAKKVDDRQFSFYRIIPYTSFYTTPGNISDAQAPAGQFLDDARHYHRDEDVVILSASGMNPSYCCLLFLSFSWTT